MGRIELYFTFSMYDQKCLVEAVPPNSSFLSPHSLNLLWRRLLACCPVASDSPQKLSTYGPWCTSSCSAWSVLIEFCTEHGRDVGAARLGNKEVPKWGVPGMPREDVHWQLSISSKTQPRCGRSFREHENWHQQQYPKGKLSSQQVRGQDLSATGPDCGLAASPGPLQLCKHKHHTSERTLPALSNYHFVLKVIPSMNCVEGWYWKILLCFFNFS